MPSLKLKYIYIYIYYHIKSARRVLIYNNFQSHKLAKKNTFSIYEYSTLSSTANLNTRSNRLQIECNVIPSSTWRWHLWLYTVWSCHV